MSIIKTSKEERMNVMNYDIYTKQIESELLKEIEKEKKFTFRKLLKILELNAMLTR